MPEMKLPIKVKYSQGFQRIYATGAVGGYSGYDFRIDFYNDEITQTEEPELPPKATREIAVEIILSTLALKQLTKWLTTHLQNIEAAIGEIKEPTATPPPSETKPTESKPHYA